MRTALTVLLLLLLSVAAADARRHHRHHGYYYDYIDRQPPSERSGIPGARVNPQRRETTGVAPPGAVRRGMKDLVPSNWHLEPPDPSWSGKRFVAPDGLAWLATYASPAGPEPAAEHMKKFAFADEEEITSLAGERDWIAVSGRKGDRAFFRKAVLACGGKTW